MTDLEMTFDVAAFATHAQSSATETCPERPSETARLIALVLSGDRDAFGKLYSDYAAMVHGILLARVPRTDVADLAQDVFLQAFRNLSTLRNADAFGPWLAMITRNRAAEFYRRVRKTEELCEAIAIDRSDSQAEVTQVLAAIRSLPDAYRETLVLRLAEGMTGPEIAARTGLKPESVRVNLHRGMKLLREKLGLGERQ